MSFSFSSILSWFKTTAATTEADVVAIIADIKTDVSVAVADFTSALKWIAGEVPTITSDLQVALGLAQAVGIAANPEIAAAITAANVAVSALNAFAKVQSAGQTSGTSAIQTDAASLVAGYQAYTQAQAAVANAKAAAASSVTTPSS